AWVDTPGGWQDNNNGDFVSHKVGYAKIGVNWGIALRVVVGNSNYDEVVSDERWLFNQAPRTLRLEGIDQLPDLIERLTKKAESTAKKIAKRTDDVRELATAMKQVVAELHSS